jgi:hypothetical protein
VWSSLSEIAVKDYGFSMQQTKEGAEGFLKTFDLPAGQARQMYCILLCYVGEGKRLSRQELIEMVKYIKTRRPVNF